MKKFVSGILIISLVMASFFGCAHKKEFSYFSESGEKITEVVKPYGFINKETMDPNIEYELSVGNVVWSIILCETIIVPVILLGLYLYEPVEEK